MLAKAPGREYDGRSSGRRRVSPTRVWVESAMFARVRKSWRRIRSGVVAAATLAAVAACAIGVPLPAVMQKPHSAERYPCERHACGCVDAEACWRDCCCMSHGEKLAWAKREGVTPPAFVMAAAAREIIAERTAAKSGCSSCSKTACCDKVSGEDAPQAGGCCGGGQTACSPQKAPPQGVKFVMLHEAMKCRGLTVSVSLLPPALPVVTAPFRLTVCEAFSPPGARSLLYRGPYLAVESPPPDAC